MDNSFYVYFTVTNAEDFTIVLAERFRFNETNWFCGLVDFQLSRNVKGPLYLCSDILKNNFINTQKHPVIARISKNPPSSHVIYTPIRRIECESIKLYLIDTHNQISSLKNQTLHGTLHFKQQ